MIFVNREKELRHLKREYNKEGASFIVLYGRRRVGKTRLVEEFININDKKSIYYLAAQENEKSQIKEFGQAVHAQYPDEFLAESNFGDWKVFFKYLEKVLPKEKKYVLAIDEITFLIKENKSFTSYLQKFWDSFLSKTDVCLILSGSLVGMMIKDVLSYKSPVYGRRTSQINLKEMSFEDICGFIPEKKIEEKIKFFSVTGGVPKYLELVNAREDFDTFLKEEVLTKEGFFYGEGLFLLSQEFKEPSTYINILKSISYGNTKIDKIANFVGIDTRKISAYLSILRDLGLIRKEVPITENPKRFRGAIYLIDDNFLTFWHRFVQPNRSKIEMRKDILGDIRNEVNAYVGIKFEDVCKEYVKNNKVYEKIGRWWHKDKEIDIVALGEDKILFGECKWKEKVDALKVISELKEKAKDVKWGSKNRKEKYVVFAKSFKEKLKGCYDLVDLEKFFK